MVAKFAIVATSKVVYVPFTVKAKDGGEDTKFMRTGIRIDMADGSWWFHHFKRGTWTQHYPRVQATTHWGAPAVVFGTGEPIFTPERVERYKDFTHIVREWGKRTPKLVAALLEGQDQALEDEAEKRGA